MIVAIDGPAGVGKSSIAKTIAQKLNISFLNSGNFYRVLTYSMLEKKIQIIQKDNIIDIAKNLNLSIIEDEIYLNCENIEHKLHTDEVDAYVAQVSAYTEVREIINNLIRKLYANKDFVCEGRDMTTVLFPDATYKFFLDASPSVRAKRRYKQGTSNLSYEKLLEQIEQRDLIDRNKEVGRLHLGENVIYIDTSSLTIDQVLDKILKNIK